MKHVNGSCKFCAKVLTLEIDDGYDVLADPFKLVGLAACNRCADLRVRRRTLNTTLCKIAAHLQHDRSKENVDEARQGFTMLIKRYLILVSDWTKGTSIGWSRHNTAEAIVDPQRFGLAWDDQIVEMLVKDPTQIADVISRLWPARAEQQQATLI